MCEVTQYIKLVEANDCQITFCKACKTFSLAYKACCASFTPEEFDQFQNLLANLNDWDFHYDFIGQKMTIVKNPLSCVGFCLTRSDAAILKRAIRESLILYDAFHIIYQ